jgi:ATP-dependent RNA helicase DeaD
LAESTHQIAGTFADLGVTPELLSALTSMGYEGPTPVQQACWGPGTNGDDLVVQSKTGSGKTTAFGLPLVARVAEMESLPNRPRALLLGPTRELCAQVCRELTGLAKDLDLNVTPIYGGVGFQTQIDALEAGTQVVVATPGRLLDHLRRGNIKLDRCEIAVLDEADEMLSMGFWEEVTGILKRMPSERQIMLFSATLPPRIERAAKQFMTDPSRIDLGGESRTVAGVDHRLYLAQAQLGLTRNLLNVLETVSPTNAIIFCNRKDEVDVVSAFLRRQLWDCSPIHGDMPQVKREKALERVRGGRSRLLIATDVAARGIDIRGLDAVISTDFSRDPEIYVHRAGRTGRIGKGGLAATLIWPGGNVLRRTITQRYNVKFEEVPMPDRNDATDAQAERIIADLTAAGAEMPLDQFLGVAEKLYASPDGPQAIAYLLFQHTKKSRAESTSSDEDRPSRGRSGGGGGGGGGGRSGGRDGRRRR